MVSTAFFIRPLCQWVEYPDALLSTDKLIHCFLSLADANGG